MERFGGRQKADRQEDRRLLTGGGRYTDDLVPADALHLAVVRSPHAHARIAGIDTAEAAAAPGVLAVLTGAELAADGIGVIPNPPLFKRPDGSEMNAPARHPMAIEAARFVGEAVACVVAETRAQARDAADQVAVDYEPLPAVASLRDAGEADIVARMRHGDAEATAAAFAGAARVTTLEIVNNRLIPSAMEPRAAWCAFDRATGHYTLTVGAQNPATVREMLAGALLKVPPEKVRVRVHDIGGGFGMKAHINPEEALVAWAAGRLGRTVAWRAERSDEFLSGTHGRDHVTTAELALNGDGRILGLRVRDRANLGAYIVPPGAVVPLMLGPKVMPSVYKVPVLDVQVDAVLTNTTPVGPYRGAGRPEGVNLMERLIDRAAAETGRDPVELRRLNMIPPSAMPYTSAIGERYDTGEFARFLDGARARADWDGYAARREASRAKGRMRGRAVVSYIEWTGGNQFTEDVGVTVSGDGKVTVVSATQEMGQGLKSTYAQLAARRLGVPLAAIEVVQGDTDLARGFGSMGSRSLFVGGSAVDAGTLAAVDKGRELAAEALEAAAADIELKEGRFAVAGTDLSIGLFELAARQPEGRFAVQTSHTVESGSWPNGSHVVEVEVDPETGRVAVDRYVTLDDVGNAINRAIVNGQVHGGVAQGIGQALLEQAVYDADGQLLTGSYMDYSPPRADDLPAIDNAIDESVPCLTNPLGAKGAGESGAVAAPPAVLTAVLDALRPLGVADLDMPATPYRVWQAIRDAVEAGTAT